MWKCRKCGETFEEKAKKCWACGTMREDEPSFEPDTRPKKKFRYRWVVQGKEYIGTRDFPDDLALREHIKKVGGELLEIL